MILYSLGMNGQKEDILNRMRGMDMVSWKVLKMQSYNNYNYDFLLDKMLENKTIAVIIIIVMITQFVFIEGLPLVL